MAIIQFTFKAEDVPAGATNVQLKAKGTHIYGQHDIWLWETHKGLCLSDREMNGYDDSDFYMTVWNVEKGEPQEICFASTRGWTYPAMGSYVDATPEIRAAYEAWEARKKAEARVAKRKAQANTLRANRKLALEAGREHGFPHYRLTKLRHEIPSSYEAVLKLVASKRLRSNFKLSMQKQAITWLQQDKPQYKSPFSHKQLACLTNQEGGRWGR